MIPLVKLVCLILVFGGTYQLLCSMKDRLWRYVPLFFFLLFFPVLVFFESKNLLPLLDDRLVLTLFSLFIPVLGVYMIIVKPVQRQPLKMVNFILLHLFFFLAHIFLIIIARQLFLLASILQLGFFFYVFFSFMLHMGEASFRRQDVADAPLVVLFFHALVTCSLWYFFIHLLNINL